MSRQSSVHFHSEGYHPSVTFLENDSPPPYIEHAPPPPYNSVTSERAFDSSENFYFHIVNNKGMEFTLNNTILSDINFNSDNFEEDSGNDAEIDCNCGSVLNAVRKCIICANFNRAV